MAQEIVMPKVAMAMNEGKVTEWVKQNGEKVEKGEPLFSIETEKTAYEVEATGGGILHIVVEKEETVPVGTVLALLAEEGEDLDALKKGVGQNGSTPASNAAEREVLPQPSQAKNKSHASSLNGRIKASPLAKKIAEVKGIDLSLVKGSGPNGRIKKRDVEAFVSSRVSLRRGSRDAALLEKARIPLQGMRKSIADHMVASLQHSAQVSQGSDVEVDRLLAVRKTFVAKEEEFGTRVSLMAFFIKALAVAAKAVPISNARIEGDEIVIYDNINVAIAVSVPGEHEYTSGLIAPVLKNANAKGLVEIDKEAKQLIEMARAGTLTGEHLSDGTITLSSSAGLTTGWGVSTPILNNGQCVIVQPGNIVDRPVVREGAVVPGKVLSLSLTFDHRIMDGEPLGRFQRMLTDCMEHPELILA